MEKSPSWEANTSKATQEISPHFMEPDDSSPYSQQPATYPYLSQIDPVYAPIQSLKYLF